MYAWFTQSLTCMHVYLCVRLAPCDVGICACARPYTFEHDLLKCTHLCLYAACERGYVSSCARSACTYACPSMLICACMYAWMGALDRQLRNVCVKQARTGRVWASLTCLAAVACKMLCIYLVACMTSPRVRACMCERATTREHIDDVCVLHCERV